MTPTRRHVLVASAATGTRTALWATCAALVVLTMIAFQPAFSAGYQVIDDPEFVTQNPMVLRGLTWPGIRWAFETGHGDYWHPITWLSLMVDVTLFGRGPASLHAVNVIVHAANSVLLLLLLRRWTGRLWPAALTAALFALHPLRVESVAWITERKDVLSMLFFLLTLWAYTRMTQLAGPKAKAWYLLALLAFALGLMTKAVLVTTPFVLLLLDYWPLNRKPSGGDRIPAGMVLGRLLAEKIPFLALSAISLWITSRSEPQRVPTFTLADLPVPVRLETVFITYAQYLEKTFWPVRLAAYYPHPWRWSATAITISAALILLLSGAAVALRRRWPFLFTGWFWFLGTTLPTLGLTGQWFQYMADRFTYLPHIGLFIALVWGGWAVAGRCRKTAAAGVVLAAVVIAGCIARTRDQTRYWLDSGTLFNHALKVGAKSDLAYEVLSRYFVSTGRIDEAIATYRGVFELHREWPDDTNPFRAASGKSPRSLRAAALVNMGCLLGMKNDVQEAAACFTRALELNPANSSARNNLGAILVRTGHPKEAIAQYENALRDGPPSADIYCNLGSAQAATGALDAALENYRRALALDPGFSEARVNLADALSAQGRIDEALEQLTEAARRDPGSPALQNDLGNLLFRQQRPEEALQHFQSAVQLNPADAESHSNLGVALALKNRIDEAIHEFSEAVRIAPNRPEYHNNLAHALEQQGRFESAEREYRESARLAPTDPAAHFNLGRVLAELNQTQAAIEQITETLRLKPDDLDAANLLRQLRPAQ
jgi:tetratricopeptide (TPR) repeat protein